MVRVVLFAAGPTPWDVDDRLTGNTSLPLTDEARAAVADRVNRLPDTVSAIYRCKGNEAVDETAKLVARRFGLRPRHDQRLAEINLGLWQGMRREDVRHRYPTVAAQWKEQPMTVEPPEGETLQKVIHRLEEAFEAILARNRAGTVALVLRPLSLQIVAGLLKGQTPEQIAGHLQSVCDVETIEVA